MGRYNSYKFGTPSTDGKFIDYFEEKLSIGDTVVFIDNSVGKNSRDFCRAKITDLKPGTTGKVDYALVTDVEYSYPNDKPVHKKDCDLLIKVNS